MVARLSIPANPIFLDALARQLATPAAREELQSIRKESDRGLWFSDLLGFGRRLQAEGKAALAAELYGWLANQDSAPAEITQGAQQELNALQGKGAFGRRAEILLAQILKDAADPKLIVPMMAASVIGSLSKAFAMSRLTQLPVGLLTRGTGAKLLSGAAAFGLEGLAFASLGHAMSPGSGESFGAELAKSYLGLGALKFSGWTGLRLARPILGLSSAPVFQAVVSHSVPQLSMFLGLLLSRQLETRLGFIPKSNADHEVADTLAALVSLQLGAKLGHAALGEGFHRDYREVELRNQMGSGEIAQPATESLNPKTKSADKPIVMTQFLPTLDELFRQREKELETMAGSLLMTDKKRSGQNFQPAELQLTLPNLHGNEPAASPRPDVPRAEMAAGGDGPYGPRMGLRLELQQGLEVRQRLELDDEARRQLEWALHYWETKPHSEMKFPLGVMTAALGIQNKPGTDATVLSGEFAAEFIVVSPREIKELDGEEKSGVLLGNCIIVSEEVPEAYLPMVVANLAFLQKVRDDHSFRDVVRDSKISVEDSRHWTANILDLVLAKEYFTESPSEYAQYLQWRKQVERTDFFKHPAIDAILQGRLSYQNFKRTTHPTARSFYAKRSWVLGGLLQMMGSRAVENAKLLGITKADLIVRELAEYRHVDFDPEYMMRLIQSLPEIVQTRRVRAVRQNYIDLKSFPQLRAQARLLTEEAVGRDPAILEELGHSGEFALKIHYNRSLRALSDRLVYFLREGLLHSGLTRKTLLFLRGAMPLLAENPGRPVAVQLQSGHERAHLQIKMKELDRQIESIQTSLDRYLALRIKYVDLGSIEYIPGPIDEQYRSLLRLKGRLDGELAEVTEAYRLLTDAEKLFQEQRALLGALLATESSGGGPGHEPFTH